ncbi:MAG: alkaline phosphatase PhoX [Gammaproteobacteria bacterium]
MKKSAHNNLLNRRELLRRGAFGSLGIGIVGNQIAVPTVLAANGSADDFGPLLPPDANGVSLPAGFSSRVVATTGQAVGNSDYIWHGSPDGGACFATGDGGWVYVSNAELSSNAGGVGVIRFANDGTVIDGYSILTGTTYNCAGGPTPWGTWLSCEETSLGQVWECDPFSPGSEGIVRPLMGRFKHEAAAVDPVNQHIYLTEDERNGLLYRFVPDNYPNLDAGVLQAAEILDPDAEGLITIGKIRNLAWHEVPDPDFSMGTPTRDQVPAATVFRGGEGCWYEAGLVYFSTKRDDRIWRFDIAANEISIVYDAATITSPVLTGVDNVFVSPNGEVYVAEDTGDMQIVALTQSGNVTPIVQVIGVSGSEICGPALSPDGSRLYFSSQRNPGMTFEISGPWLGNAAANSARLPTFGLAASGLFAAALAAYGAIRSR